MSEGQGGGTTGQGVVADVSEMLVAAQQIDNSREVLGERRRHPQGQLHLSVSQRDTNSTNTVSEQ